MNDVRADAAKIGALADPTRSALYEHVIAQTEALGRDAAADALGIPSHTAKFHLDKLVEAGLLAVEFRRLSGRSGPGAGRPSKLYRRATGTVSVSLPERQYDLAGHLLATAIERAADGDRLLDAIDEVAHAAGAQLGAASGADPQADEFERLGDVLATQGYEPRAQGERMLLANCPFDTLARQHTELICHMNRAYIEGVVDGIGCAHLRAELEPDAQRCCVAVHRDAASASARRDAAE